LLSPSLEELEEVVEDATSAFSTLESDLESDLLSESDDSLLDEDLVVLLFFP